MAAIDDITNLYVGYFNRAPDPTGLNFWVAQRAAGASLEGIANSFSLVPEAQNLYGFLSAPLVGNAASFLSSVYLNLFGRVANATTDPTGFTYWQNQLTAPGAVVGRIIVDIISGAQGNDALVVANKSAVGKAFAQNILDNNAVFSSTLAANAFVGVTSDSATVTTVTATNLTAILATAGAAGGQTFTLAASTDNITGTSANDTIIGDFATTVQASDQINAGGGTDTLRLFGAYDAAKLPTSATGLEILEIVASGNNSINSTVIAGLTKLQVNDASLATTQTFTTGSGVALQLATAGGVATAGANTFATSGATANLILNGFQGGTGVTAQALTVTDATASTLNITSQGSANATAAFTGPATATTINIASATALTIGALTSTGAATVNISGAGNTTVTGTDLAAVLAVNAGTATGKVSYVAVEASTLTFTGGSGNDSVIYAAGTLTTADKNSGGAGADTLGINDTTPVYAAINAATDFEVLGLFTTGATVDKANLTTINSFFVNTGSQTFQNSLATTTYTLNNAAGLGTIAIANKTGDQSTSVTIDLGTTATAQTITALNFTGAPTVSLVSQGGVAGGTGNTITTFGNVDNSSITLTGARDLVITNALAGTGTGSVFNASAFTGKLSVTGSAQNDVLTGGTGADTLLGGAGNDTINGGDGNDTITGGTGGDTINVGAGTDTIVYTAAAETFAGAVTSGVTTLTGVDVVSGMAAADKISMYATATITTATTIGTSLISAGGTADAIALVRGNFSGGVFTVSTTGADTLFQFDDNGTTAAGNIDSVVLVGFTGTAAAAANLLTLA